MFGSDPAKTLNKARRLLAEGDAAGALRLARRARGVARPPLAGEIAAFAEEARRTAVAAAEERAERSAVEGHLVDAAEWLRGALEYAEDDRERARLAARLRELETQAEERAEAESPDGWDAGEPLEPAGGEGAGGPSAEELYEVFVDALRDDVAARYRGRPPEFRRALLEFTDASDAEAARTIESLAGAAPDDPVLRFERGRWRLVQGDAAGARADLEAAWSEFGDQPLDLSGLVSIPAIWCEAALAAGDHAAVIERLEERGELTLADPDLNAFYAHALLDAGEEADALSFLAEAIERFPRRADLAHLLARGLHHRGDGAAAIEVLERSLRSCGAGCSASDLDPQVLRLLAECYAEAGGPVERLGDVLRMLCAAEGGELEPADWRLQARYHDLADEPDAAERARARAGVPAGTQWAGEGPPPAPAYEDDG